MPPPSSAYQRRHTKKVASALMKTTLTLCLIVWVTPPIQMCDATAKQRFISVAAQTGGICVVHNCSGLMTNDLGCSIEKMRNAAARSSIPGAIQVKAPGTDKSSKAP